VWCDELWILRNVTAKSFRELLGPLTDQQAAPPLFLWLERSIWLAFGDSLFALRFPQLLASCGVIVLLYWVARRCLDPLGVAWAMLLFGVCDPVLDHTCEVKPYVIDAFLAVAALAGLIATENWPVWRRAALLALAGPLIIFLSYPGCFVCGGVLLALVPDAWKTRRDGRVWGASMLAAATCAGAFLLLLEGPIRSQKTGDLQNWWTSQYLVLGNPLRMAGSCLEGFATLFEHFWRPTGGVLMLPFAVGAVCLTRKLTGSRVAMLAGPCLLAIMASFLQSYPFESRLLLFCLPLLCLVIAEGLAEISRAIHRELASTQRTKSRMVLAGMAAAVLGVVVVWPCGKTAYSLAAPRVRLTNEVWPESEESRINATTPQQIWARHHGEQSVVR